jgi:hypothetical protein
MPPRSKFGSGPNDQSRVIRGWRKLQRSFRRKEEAGEDKSIQDQRHHSEDEHEDAFENYFGAGFGNHTLMKDFGPRSGDNKSSATDSEQSDGPHRGSYRTSSMEDEHNRGERLPSDELRLPEPPASSAARSASMNAAPTLNGEFPFESSPTASPERVRCGRTHVGAHGRPFIEKPTVRPVSTSRSRLLPVIDEVSHDSPIDSYDIDRDCSGQSQNPASATLESLRASGKQAPRRRLASNLDIRATTSQTIEEEAHDEEGQEGANSGSWPPLHRIWTGGSEMSYRTVDSMESAEGSAASSSPPIEKSQGAQPRSRPSEAIDSRKPRE